MVPADPRAPLRLAAAVLPRDATPALVYASPALEHTASDVRTALESARPADDEQRRAIVRESAWARAIEGEHAPAIGAVAAAIGRLDTASARVLRELAALATLRGDLVAADAALDAARRARPDDPTLISDHAAVRLARGRARDAVTLFREVVERAGGDEAPLDARRDLAGALLAAGDARAALAMYSALALECPTDTACLLDVAHAALEANQVDRAVSAARRATEHTAPNDAEPFLVLGAALSQAGRRAEAIRAFRDALARRPGDGRARQGLRGLGIAQP